MTAYASARDLYTYGLRRGVLVNEGRLVASSAASSNILELDGHLFETDDAVRVRAVDGGTLSVPLAADTVYYVIRLSDSTFKLATTEGGAPIDLTTDGESMIVTADLPIDDLLEAYSRFADDFIPAHAVPMAAPYDLTLVRIVCELTAAKLLSLAGQSSVSMKDAEIAAKAQLERWATGVTLRSVAAAATPTNLAITSTVSTDPRGWGSGSLP